MELHEVVNYGMRGQSVVGWRAVDLLILPLDPIELVMKCLGLVLESLSAGRATSIEL
jgi:hypothetical protein